MLLVLVCLLGLMSVVLASMESSFKQSYGARLLEAEIQADMRADAALDVVGDLLQHDLDEHSDSLEEPWVTPWHYGDVSFTISPCNARLNLNFVLDANRTRSAVETLVRQERRSPQSVLQLQDWLDSDRDERVFGSEGKGFAHLGRTYRQRDGDLKTVEEILLVDGWQDASPDWIRENFTVWSAQSRLNVNFASEDVFKAYLPELADDWDRFERWRTNHGGLTDISQLQKAIPTLARDVDLYTSVLPLLTLATTTFRVIIEVDAPLVYVKRRYIVSRESDVDTGGLKVYNQGALVIRPKELF